ncbi:MAG TPA: S46 family peptidase [Burkholderiales bacterium]|nr:S46 family peptidase [Burkholderiales bacterium]
MRVRGVAALLCIASCAAAEEGMWPPAYVSRAPLERTLGVRLSPELVQRLQWSTVKYGGATAFFASPQGLLVTNHHVALRCIQTVSARETNYHVRGFVARTHVEELRCPGQDVRVLMSYEDVTSEISKATAGIADADRPRAEARHHAAIERRCHEDTGLRCEVVTLYGGARRLLYRYRLYDDVRLVASPESSIAYFGGDPDNFEYPRYGLDVTLLRVYENGAPVRPPAHLALARAAPREGDVAIGVGHPFRTSRGLPLAQLETLRDVHLPLYIAANDHRIKLLSEFRKSGGPDAAQGTRTLLFSARNSFKRDNGYLAALRAPQTLAAQRVALERLATALPEEGRSTLAAVLAAAADLARNERARARESYYVSHFTGSRLLEWAVLLVRWAGEVERPEEERLDDFRGGRLAATEQWIRSGVPVYPSAETAVLRDRWAELPRQIGAEHPYAAAVKTLDAAALVNATSLADPAVRRSLLAGGPQAIRGSQDPLLVAARALEPHLYPVRAHYEREIRAPLARLAAALAKLKFAAYGENQYPDAEGSLRFAFGRLEGYDEDGMRYPWHTTLGGMYERAERAGNASPWFITQTWRKLRASIDPATPYNFVATVDHRGGNSGSPVVNVRGEWFGVQHDGNRQNFGTQYAYTTEQARMIAVHADAVLEWLRARYGATALIEEIRGH